MKALYLYRKSNLTLLFYNNKSFSVEWKSLTEKTTISLRLKI